MSYNHPVSHIVKIKTQTRFCWHDLLLSHGLTLNILKYIILHLTYDDSRTICTSVIYIIHRWTIMNDHNCTISNVSRKIFLYGTGLLHLSKDFRPNIRKLVHNFFYIFSTGIFLQLRTFYTVRENDVLSRTYLIKIPFSSNSHPRQHLIASQWDAV